MLLSLSIVSLTIIEVMQFFKLGLDLNVHFVIIFMSVKDVLGVMGLWLLECRNGLLNFEWLWSEMDGFWFNLRKSHCSVMNLAAFLLGMGRIGNFGLVTEVFFVNNDLLWNFLLFVLLSLLNNLGNF